MSGDLLERFGRFYPAGSIIFHEGDPAAEMFVIHSGSVTLTRRLRDLDAVLAVLPAGEFFGEMAIVNKRPRSATATTAEDSWLLVIDSRTFEAMIRGKAEIAVRLIKTLAGRLERANQQIDLLLLKNANHRVVQCLRQLAEQTAGHEEGADTFLPMTMAELAGRVALDEAQVVEVVARLEAAGLVMRARAAGLDAEGFIVPEVGRLVDFLEFLEIRERFAEDPPTDRR